jgi:hypothetical protein
MKKLLVLFVALAVASTAFAADFSFSWDTDFGWAAGDNGAADEYNLKVNEMELAVAADVDEYNSFSTQIEPGDTENANNPAAADEIPAAEMFDELFMDSVKITTDLGAYFALSGVGLVWTNGYFDAGDQEYADQLNVGNQFVEAAGSTSKDLMTKVTLDFGMFAVDASANWDIMGKEYDGEDTDQEFYISVYSTSLVEGLAVEANFNMADNGGGSTINGSSEVKKSIFDIQANYVYDLGDGMMLTFAGEFGTDSEAETDLTDPDDPVFEQVFGAGVQFDYAIDEDLTADVSVSFAGDDDESFRVFGGGASLYTDAYGLDVDMNYAVAEYSAQNEDGEYADGDLLYTDISAWFKPGAPKFRLGYAVTEFGQANNSRATVPTNGGLYMKVECDF